ncbi:hypothetical protein [Pedobacter nutrimenti]|uniref:Uncharacterized protein n=1 Tax=Pedobacter nutrimenti TaxID=1241337 RepID=A0A318UJJ1_9SPHI|nr:hypothetical protein [Pedobacter nutrimenti]PYF75477.1 hypothetical protein B0O44_10226 [Pedobacter nutrimenti]
MEKVSFTDHFSLKLQLKASAFMRHYAVKHRYAKGDQEQSVKYNMDVSYVRTLLDRSRIFRLERSEDVYVNDSEPDLIADELAYACGKVFYPLLLEIDFEGKYLSVYNYDEIIARWKTLRPKVNEYFKGIYTEKYLDLMDLALSSSEQVSRIFRQDLFVTSFFVPLYINYGPELKKENQVSVPLLSRVDPFRFASVQQVNPLLNEAGNVEIECKGNACDPRTEQDLLDGHCFPIEQLTNPEATALTGEYAARYVLEPETKAIRSIYATWLLDFESQEETELKIFEILEQDQQEIKEQGQEPIRPGMVFIDGGKSGKERKITSIFNFLWD